MAQDKNAWSQRRVRHKRLRKRLNGTTERPRLAVFRSLRHIYAQVIDDATGMTVVAASSQDSEIKNQRVGKPKSEIAKMVGTLVAQRALDVGVSKAVFDRGGYKYHGRTQALANAAREGGLKL